jgi:hypothetical protein
MGGKDALCARMMSPLGNAERGGGGERVYDCRTARRIGRGAAPWL